MDFLNEIFNNIDINSNPTLFYTVGLVVLIMIIFMVRSFLQMIMVFAALAIVVLMLLYFTGNEVKTVEGVNLSSITNKITNQYNNIKNKVGLGDNSEKQKTDDTNTNTNTNDDEPDNIVEDIGETINNEGQGIINFIINLIKTMI